MKEGDRKKVRGGEETREYRGMETVGEKDREEGKKRK